MTAARDVPRTEDLLGFCTECVRMRWLAVELLDGKATPHGVCRSCRREQDGRQGSALAEIVAGTAKAGPGDLPGPDRREYESDEETGLAGHPDGNGERW